MEMKKSIVGPKLVSGNQELSVGCGRFEMPMRDLRGDVENKLDISVRIDIVALA